jgi:hypothetical protein
MTAEGIKITTQSANKQIFICGVDGAGKKSVAALLFPGSQYCFQSINSDKNTLVIVVLDGVHQQNCAEEQLLKKIAKLQQRFTKKSITTLLVLNKTGLFANTPPVSKHIHQMYESYKSFCAQHKVRVSCFIPLSTCAAKLCHIADSKTLNAFDSLNVRILLRQIGRSFSEQVTDETLLQYIIGHKKQLETLSGKLPLEKFIKNWRKDI